MRYHDESGHAFITPEQAIDLLHTVTEGVVEFMRCYDSPESRRLISALQTASTMVRMSQRESCQDDPGSFEDDDFGEVEEGG